MAADYHSILCCELVVYLGVQRESRSFWAFLPVGDGLLELVEVSVLLCGQFDGFDGEGLWHALRDDTVYTQLIIIVQAGLVLAVRVP